MPPEPLKWRSVYSSHVDAVAYDKNKQELLVKWQTGKTSAYSGVPEALATSVMNSYSVGGAVKDQIKSGGFAHRYV